MANYGAVMLSCVFCSIQNLNPVPVPIPIFNSDSNSNFNSCIYSFSSVNNNGFDLVE